MNAAGRHQFSEPRMGLLPPLKRLMVILGLASFSWAALIAGALESF